MSLSPDLTELLARARADLRMGVPVILNAEKAGVVIIATETATQTRLNDLRGLGDALVLAVTARRAETLKARAYDGTLARIAVPSGADIGWIHAVADPKDDLRSPMK